MAVPGRFNRSWNMAGDHRYEITGRDRMIILGNVLISKNCNEKRGGG